MDILSVNSLDFNGGSGLFASLEAQAHQKGCQAAREALREKMEQLDEAIMKNRNKRLFRCINIRESTVKTIMGEVSYRRRCYKITDDRNGYTFLLDEYLGLGNGLFSESLKDMVVNECLNMSFRKAACAVSTMTNQSISHGEAWNILQERGAKLVTQEERLAAHNEKHGLRGDLETKVLFEEMDGVWLSMQGKDRPKKTGKREIKVATHYSGWKKTAQDRYGTVGKISYAGFDEPDEFHKKREAQVARYYNTDEIDVRVLSGDGANWIRGTDEDVIMQLDPFHRSRAIMRGLPDKAVRAHVNRLLKDRKVTEALRYIADMKESVVGSKEKERICKLYKYLSDNKDTLLTWKERGVELPAPPAGIVYRCLGTQEHSNCVLITNRMKRRNASWGIKGGGHMAKLINLRATLKSVGRLVFTELVFSQTPAPLSVAKTPKYDGKGCDGGLPHGGWPFENTFVTESRKAMKDIFHIKLK